MPKCRARLPQALAGLMRSEWERIIAEANFGDEDAAIARAYLIDQLPQVDIACDLGIGHSTVQRRVVRILDRAQDVAGKLNT